MKRIILCLCLLISLYGCNWTNETENSLSSGNEYYHIDEYYKIYWHEVALNEYLVRYKTDIKGIYSYGRGELEWKKDGKNYAIICSCYNLEDMERCCREGEVEYIDGVMVWINITYETPNQKCW